MEDSVSSVDPVHGLVDDLREQVAQGRLAPGALLPSTRDLAVRYGVSKRAVVKALHELDRDGVIDCRPRRRASVRKRWGGSGNILTVIRQPDHVAAYKQPRWMGWILMAADQALLAKDRVVTRVLIDEDVSDDQQVGKLEEALARFGDRAVDGVLLTGASKGAMLQTKYLDEQGIPWVSIKRLSPQTQHNFVEVDRAAAGQVVGELFALSQFESLLYVDLHPSEFNLGSMSQFSGMQFGYMNAGGMYENIRCLWLEESDVDKAAEVFSAYAKVHGMPRAVFAGGDYLGLDIIQAVRSMGLSVPGDVAVVGGTGLELPDESHRELTAVRQPMHAVGQEAARLLIEMLEKEQTNAPGIQLLPDLVIRKSFCPDQAVIESVDLEFASKISIESNS